MPLGVDDTESIASGVGVGGRRGEERGTVELPRKVYYPNQVCRGVGVGGLGGGLYCPSQVCMWGVGGGVGGSFF